MECNKEEAKRAMELATKKIKEHDFDGAERMIAKAVSMDPDVSFPYWIPKDPRIWRDPVNVEANEARDSAEERFKEGDYNGAISMIDKAEFLNPDDVNAACDYANRRLAYSIHLTASSCKMADGGIDWHTVLGVSPSDGYDTVSRKYRMQLCDLHDHSRRSTGCTAMKGARELTRLSWVNVRRRFDPWRNRPPASKRDKEAARMAMDMAEEKFKAGDYEGAMCMAGRAGSLDPDLPGAEELEAVYRVHYANAKFKTAEGETDWYAVLGVDPSLDLDTITDQSDDICNLVHQGHSYSSAAEEAYWIATKAMVRIIEEREPNIGSQPLDPKLVQPMKLV